MEPLLTIKEAAELTRLSEKTLYTFAENGKVPHIKLGRRTFFNEKKLEAWVEENSVTPGEAASSHEGTAVLFEDLR